jgi:hypothetical protein
MSSLSFYNAAAYGLTGNFKATVTLKTSGDKLDFPVTADTDNDRIIVSMAAGKEVCLSSIASIRINKVQ